MSPSTGLLGCGSIDDGGDRRRECSRGDMDDEDPPETVKKLQLPLGECRPRFTLFIIEIRLRHVVFIDLLDGWEIGDLSRMNRQFVLAGFDGGLHWQQREHSRLTLGKCLGGIVDEHHSVSGFRASGAGQDDDDSPLGVRGDLATGSQTRFGFLGIDGSLIVKHQRAIDGERQLWRGQVLRSELQLDDTTGLITQEQRGGGVDRIVQDSADLNRYCSTLLLGLAREGQQA